MKLKYDQLKQIVKEAIEDIGDPKLKTHADIHNASYAVWDIEGVVSVKLLRETGKWYIILYNSSDIGTKDGLMVEMSSKQTKELLSKFSKVARKKDDLLV